MNPQGSDCYVTTNGGATVAAVATNSFGTSNTLYYYIPAMGSFTSAYPNPAKDLLTLEFTTLKFSESLPSKIEILSEHHTKPVIYVPVREIYDKNGFADDNKIQIDVKNLSRGIYYLHVSPALNSHEEKSIVRILLE